MGKPFTKEEISTLVSMWPNASVAQIAGRLHRPYGSILAKAKQLRTKGFLLEAKNTPRSRLPDPQDFDEVKMVYCRKHNITVAELCARLKEDDQLMAELYRLALATKLEKSRVGDEAILR